MRGAPAGGAAGEIARLPRPYPVSRNCHVNVYRIFKPARSTNSEGRQKTALTLRLTASHVPPATLRTKQISSFLSKGRGGSPLPPARKVSFGRFAGDRGPHRI